MTIDKVKYLRRHAMLLILLLTGWAAGVTASASTQVTLVPDIGSNLTGTETSSGMQPLESMTAPAQLAMVEFQQYNGNTAPAYYSNGNTIRLYSGNLFTVFSPISYIERIEFHSVAYKSSESTLLTVDGEMLMYDPETLIYTWEGVYSEWGGGLTDVSFLINDTQLRLSKIVVTLAGDIEVEGLPKSPVLSKSTGSFSEDFTLTITDPNSPKTTVRYTLDGTEPTASTGTVYTGPITIKAGADVTVKAVAVNADNAVSPTVSATYRFEQKYRFSVRLLNPGGVQRYYLSSNSYYGYWNTDNSILASEGESIWVDISYNTGYRAKSIKLDGNALEQSQNYYFTMPANDTELTIETVFDPNSPSDPQPADTTRYYTLSVVANPLGAASTSGSGKYKEGRNINVNASARSGYLFTGWTYNGVQWGDNEPWQSLTMPAGDVVLTANYVYNPSSPSEPQQPALKHPLTAVASPAGAATFRLSASSVTYGQQYTVTATPRQGYVLKNWIVNGEPVDETSTTLWGIMTEKGAQVVGLFVFDPSSPDDPGANHYNPSTGQMILDNFKPGNLYQAARRLTDGNLDQVSNLIVKGVMNSTDMEYLRYFNNAGIIDFSRTSGVSSVSSYIFEGVGANTLILPSTVTEMKSYVFNGCDNLTSIVCYAQEPPVCQSGTFSGFGNADRCTVYVPASAIELYSEAEYWKNLTILPITNDAHVLQVNLPEEAADGRYKHNSLEIVNINTGVRQKYVVSDRLIYTFNGLQKDEQYNVYLYSQAGLEIGRIEDVLIPDSDTAVSFMNLRELFTVSALVTDKDGADVTGDVAVEWLKPLADGTTVYLRKSTSLGEIPDGQALVCRVTLPETLATAYEQPGDVEFTVDSDNNSCRIALAPLRQVAIKGRVTDIDGAFIQGASVSAVQTLNGKYQKTFTTKTDRKGEWTLSLLDAPETRITYAASECVNRCDTVGAFDPAAEVTDLGIAALRSIVGARITCGFSYLEAGQEEATDYFDDYRNVTVSVFNLSQNRQHQDVSFQYPLIAVLDENIAPGDAMRLTATSKTGAFNPVDEIVVLGNDSRGDVTFSITGKGGISAAFEMTDNPAVIAMLYSAKGELLKKQTYSEAKTAFTALEDGDYTVISMGQSDLMNSILRLSSFDEIGLTEGKDYVKNTVTVESGKLSEIKIPEVPAFDEGLFYYTNSSTSFSSNKSSITTGNYLTLRSTIDFKGVYKNDISNVALVVDMPEACDFVEQSVIQGPNLLPYTLDNNRLTIQLGNNYQSQIRFCVVPTTGGSFNATASVVFDYNGKTLTQPIGSAASEIKDIEITVPSVIAGTTFKVSGVALGNSMVNVYEDGTLLGSGKANAAGSWNVECDLSNPYNLSTHSVYAEITTPAGNTLTSESKTLTYDRNALQVSKVTMYHYNPEMHKTYESVFDFLNPKTTATQWTVYYPKKQFTYTIEFTDNDPERISNVILYVHTADGKFVPVNASFDEKKGMWYAEIDMGTSSDGYYPVNCSVDFDYESDKLLDTGEFSNIRSELANISINFTDIRNTIDDLINSSDDSQIEDIEITEVEDWASILDEAIGGVIDSEEGNLQNSLQYYLSLNEMELDEFIASSGEINEEEELTEINNSVQIIINALSNDSFNEIILDNGAVMSVKTCDGITEESLIERGFEVIATTEGKGVYILRTDFSSEVVDFDNNYYTVITYSEVTDISPISSIRRASKLDEFNEVMDRINSLYQPIAHAWEKTNTELLNFVDRFYQDYCKHASDYGLKKARYNSKLAKLIKLKEELKGLNSLTIDYHVKLGEIKSLEKEVKAAKRLMNNAAKLKSLAKAAHNLIKPLPGIFAKRLPLIKYADAIYTFLSVAQKYQSLYLSIPNPCKDDQAASDNLRCSCVQEAVATEVVATLKLGTSAVLDLATFGAVSTAVGTGGASLIVAAGTAITNILANILIDNAFNKQVQKSINDIEKKRDQLECVKKCGQPGMPPCPDQNPGGGNGGNSGGGNKPGGGANQSGSTPDDVQIDPSGFVYEAVPANRVEGVQATIYYKETKEDMYGDPYEEVILWNAEEYAQKNPLFTDGNGMYRWDVPQGLWQVKFEKDGYQTAYSEWLPVPPPQLEVNIGIVQNKQPEVTEARAYEEGVEVQFDKFMDLSTLTPDNIYVTASGEKLNGEIRLIDSALADEYASEDDADATRYASRVRFVPEEKLSATTGEIRLTVSRNVLSYAGIPMTETFTQVLDVEKEVQTIYADDVKVLYGGEKEVTVYALPYDAAVGRTLRIVNSSDLIASIDVTEATLDEEGKAVVKVKGDLPGRTQLTFSIDDVTATGECAVDVVTEIITAEAPKSSRASGTAVYRGTKVELTTESKNATIYFTTDGSCPCDENGTRRKYTVPIVINDDTRILAITSVGNDDVSETVEFNYTLKRSDVDFRLDSGWSWISHNLETAVDPAELAADEHVTRIMSQTREVIRDPQLGMTGTLTELNASESYKVETTAATARQRLSDVAWNPATPIALGAGWNWLGYPVGQTMSVNEALAPTAAEELDVIVGQNGFAQFDGEQWIGTLETMVPGAGYMYQSRSAKNVVYNTSIVSTAAAKYTSGITSGNLPLVVDIHKYRSIMPVVATLRDESGSQLDNADYQVSAFCGSECRGLGRVINGLVMMNVYGNTGDRITIRVTDADGEVTFPTDCVLTFSETVEGDLFSPLAVIVKNHSGIAGTTYNGNVKVSAEGDMLVISGIAADSIEFVEVYDLNGQKIMRETGITESGIRITALNTGVYVVIVNGNGEYTYHKVAIR